MDRQALTSVLGRAGIRVEKVRRRPGKADWATFRCPLAPWTHVRGSDRSASAGAAVEPTGISNWYCLTCKQKGRVSTLVRDLSHYDGVDRSAILTDAREHELNDGLSVEFAPFGSLAEVEDETFPLNPAIYLGLWPDAWDEQPARDYLLSRDIDEATSRTLGLMFDTDEPRVLFPVRDRAGQLWGFTGRSTIGDRIKVKDYEGLPKRKLILGADRWQTGRPSILVEGLFAFTRMVQLGVEERFNVGALLGSVMTEEKAMILRAEDQPSYLFLDNDKAGQDGIFGTVSADGHRNMDGITDHLHGHVPLFIPHWPAGKDDPDQLDLDEVETMMDGADLHGFGISLD